MKLALVFLVVAVAAAAGKATPNNVELQPSSRHHDSNDVVSLVHPLVRELIAIARRFFYEGYSDWGLRPLDPLHVDSYTFHNPDPDFNFLLSVTNALMVGAGEFEVHTAHPDFDAMTLDLDISFPRLEITAEQYHLLIYFFYTIPVYGGGETRFVVNNLRFQAKVFLKQSDDNRAVLIDRIENFDFQLYDVKSEITGMLNAGEDLDAIVNAMIETVFTHYIDRFSRAITVRKLEPFLMMYLNPLFVMLDTWKHVEPYLPRH